jgi:regulator of protease activity HflC (stomatin/prohibitin superfamily)
MGLRDYVDKQDLPKVELPKGKIIFFGILGCILLFLLIASSQIVSNVAKGTYEVKQSWITGDVTAKMTPGWWWKIGAIQDWPVAETFYFTRGKDSKADSPDDFSVLVQFNEGSDCNISGTARVTLPKGDREAVALTVNHGYRNWEDVKEKLVRTQIRLALMLAANQMSARESYYDKRADFISMVSDQLTNGMYAYTEVEKEIEDPGTGKKVTKVVKVIKKDKDGSPVRRGNPFTDVGVSVSNLDIKGFLYSPKVQEQILKQQKAYMDIQTAVADAQKAEQEKLTAEAQGKANVATARYAEETEKIKAVVKAQKDKEVAELGASRDKSVAETAAQRDLDVAMLNTKAAEQRKLAAILEAEGFAKATRLKMESDNYQALKVQAAVDIHRAYAEALSKRRVPLIEGSAGLIDGKPGDGGMFASQKGLVDLMILKALGMKVDLGDDIGQPFAGGKK